MDQTYRLPALKQLARFTLKERRLQYLDRGEALLGEVFLVTFVALMVRLRWFAVDASPRRRTVPAARPHDGTTVFLAPFFALTATAMLFKIPCLLPNFLRLPYLKILSSS